MSGFGQSAFGSGNGGGFGSSSVGGGQFPSTPSNTGGGFNTSSSSTPLAFGQSQAIVGQQPFGSSAATATPATNAFGGGGGFGSTPAPTTTTTTTGFGTATPTASTATPFGSSATTATATMGGFGNQSSSGFGVTSSSGGGGGFGSSAVASSTTASSLSFGFGQQQQQQSSQTMSSGFGTSTNNNNNNNNNNASNNNVFESSSSSSAAPLAFGSSSTVATSQPATIAAPSSSFFGAGTNTITGATTGVPSTSVFGNTTTTTTTTTTAATTSPFRGSSGNNGNDNNNSSTTSVFGNSSTAFGGTPSNTTTGTSSASAAGGGAFGSSSTTTNATGGGFGSSTTGVTGGFGSSSSTAAGGGGANLSASAAPFTPSTSATASTGGFGSSNTTGGGFGGSGFGVGKGDKTTTANNSSGFGGGSSNNAFGGGFGGQTAAAATTSSSTSSAFGGGGFGTTTTSTPSKTSVFGNSKDSNTGEANDASSSSFGFSRIPRKEKTTPQTSGSGGGGGSGDASKSSSADGDAQLAALRAKIQEKKQRLLDKKKMQQQQSNSSDTSPPRSATDSDRNAELAAKNALRFATQQENKALSSLLPTDLQGRAQTSESNDDRSTPFGGVAGNANEDGDGDDDLAHRNVNNAKSLIGICTSMCPDEELLRREKEGDIQLLEITDPGGLHPAHWTLRDTAVKRFRRSAADFKLDIPELVRPPEVLERVCGYLEEWVMERDRQGPDKRWAQAATTTSDTPPPLDVYQFIWDRTRMIRKDFILQNYIGTGGKCDARAVRCHERIARWHAMCEHQLSHIPDFVKHQSQQNIAELGQTMKTLNLYYDDALGRALTEPASSGGRDSQGCVSDIVMGKHPVDFDGITLSNDADAADVYTRIIGKNGADSPSRGTAEPEMRGLYILLTMNNEGGMEVLKYSGRLCTQRPDIFYSKPVQLALTIFRAKKDHNYAKFFRLLRCPSTPYLFSCIMFKYVENMRKETLLMMSKVYGAKHKTTGEAFYDSYPIEKLVNLLCYEDESEAKEACRHYGITVENDEVLWRHSKFREPRDPEKGLVIPLKPRKMIRTIESKLHGATRLSVCRGGVSGQGATLSSAPASVNAEALMKERQKAQEEMKQKLAEAKAKEEAERLKQEEIKKEKLRQKRMAAEKKAKEEAARQAEKERLRQEQLKRERLEQQKREQERIEAEEKARKEAAERAERLRLEKEAQEKKEREIAEARRLAEEERKRKLAEEERIRLLEEEKRRREEEERRRIAREAELRRKAEEERIRKAKEEEERRIEMAWRQKVENARKLLICRLLRKQMRRHDSSQKSRNCLSRLDPTCTQYPTSDVDLCQDLFGRAPVCTDVAVLRRGSCDELENQVYRLATSPRRPMDLSKVVANHVPSFLSHQEKTYYPSVVRTSRVKLFKLAILLPERSPQFEHLYDTLRMWVESHLDLGEVSSSVCSSRSCQMYVRAVAVISNEDDSYCKDCDAALVLLPSFTDQTASIDFSEKSQELLGQNVPRMVLVLDTNDSSRRNALSTDRWLDTMLGESSGGAGIRREGVAAPNLCDFDLAFQKCCQVLVQSHMSATAAHVDSDDDTSVDPSLVRVPLSDLGFLCLQQLIRNLEENGFFNIEGPNLHDNLFDLCKNALSSLSHQITCAYEELHQHWQHWPASEFCESERVESFFGKDKDLPANWHELKSDVGSELKRFFQHLLERSTLTLFVESIAGSLSESLQQDLSIMLDNGEISSCLSTIVTMVVSGEINLIFDGQTILYLPVTTLFSVVAHAAAYKMPEPVEQDVGIPDYLLYGFPPANDDLEEKENSTVPAAKKEIAKGEKRTRATAESKENTISKRSRVREDNVDPNLRLLKDNEEGNSQKKLKRPKLNDGRKAVFTEEERSSKSFTSYLEALLGGDVPL